MGLCPHWNCDAKQFSQFLEKGRMDALKRVFFNAIEMMFVNLKLVFLMGPKVYILCNFRRISFQKYLIYYSSNTANSTNNRQFQINFSFWGGVTIRFTRVYINNRVAPDCLKIRPFLTYFLKLGILFSGGGWVIKNTQSLKIGSFSTHFLRARSFV